jgi:hypothetical protein
MTGGWTHWRKIKLGPVKTSIRECLISGEGEVEIKSKISAEDEPI